MENANQLHAYVRGMTLNVALPKIENRKNPT